MVQLSSSFARGFWAGVFVMGAWWSTILLVTSTAQGRDPLGGQVAKPEWQGFSR